MLFLAATVLVHSHLLQILATDGKIGFHMFGFKKEHRKMMEANQVEFRRHLHKERYYFRKHLENHIQDTKFVDRVMNTPYNKRG